MKEFFPFVEKNLDWLDIMQLTDLSKVLSQESESKAEFDLYARFDSRHNIYYVSRFWDPFDDESRILGRKSDIYLKSFGNAHFSDQEVFLEFIRISNTYRNQKFARQAFSLFEDIRIEKECLRSRPGMKLAFQVRRNLYKKIFLDKLNSSISYENSLDRTLYRIYLTLVSVSRDDISSELLSIVSKVLLAQSTRDVLEATIQLMGIIDEEHKRDCQDLYFGITTHEDSYLVFDDLVRRDEVISTGNKESDKEREGDSNQKMMTWHQDTAHSDQSLLRFDVEEGTNTDIVGEDIRMSESNDQVFAAIQGNSVQTNKRNYDIQQLKEKKMTLEKELDNDKLKSGGTGPQAIYLDEFIPNIREWGRYQDIALSQTAHQMSLMKSLQRIIEYKRNESRTNLLVGRLGKRLVPLVYDELPRPFYKKNEESKQKDAVFTLLIDCSSSMENKLDKVKRASILFHETLQSLHIPHSVCGFWEESAAMKKGASHNYFQPVITFGNCEKRLAGASILQLEAKEDNRDGFAIREMVTQLAKRNEKQKFLLVFSDGEPSASQYGENGVMDTYQAISNAKKQGIHVVGIYLSNTELNEKDYEMMKMLYGQNYIAIHDMNYLTESIANLLRKLLS